MQQRVGIAAAMLLRPRVPLAMSLPSPLDVSAREAVPEELSPVESFGTAVVLVSWPPGAGGRQRRTGAGDAPR